MPTLLRHATPTARKSHRCYTCRATIRPGEKYDRAVYLGDDGLYEWVTCPPCAELTQIVWEWAGQPWEGVTDEEIVEWAQESTDDPRAVGYLARLKGGAS